MKELLLCMLWMYIRDDLFSFLSFFLPFCTTLKKKKNNWYETTESMLMYRILFLAWIYQIQRNSVLKLQIPSFTTLFEYCRGWDRGGDLFLHVHSGSRTLRTRPKMQSHAWSITALHTCARERSLTIPKDIFVCFNIFCMFLWLRHWRALEKSLFDHFLWFW